MKLFHRSQFWIVFFILAVAAPFASGADSIPTDGSTFGFKFEPGTVTPGTMPAPETQDRGQKSKAAAAAARAGSAMQKVQCMRMMQQAQKEEDDTTKFIMMQMASQQCQQASETEKSADKNDDSAQKLGQVELPKMATVTPGKMVVTDDQGPSTGDSKMMENLVNASTSSDNKAGTKPLDFSLPAAYAPALTENVQKNGGLASAGDKNPKDPGIAGPKEPKSPLQPLAPNRVGFDETAKNPRSGVNPGGSSMMGGFGGMRTLAQNQDDTKGRGPASVDAAAVDPGKRVRGPIDDNALYGSSSGGSDGPSGSGAAAGEDPFDTMLAQLMGGGAGAPPAGSDILMFGETAEGGDPHSGERQPNLFEFASFLYSKLTYDEGRVRIQQKDEPRALTLGAISVTH